MCVVHTNVAADVRVRKESSQNEKRDDAQRMAVVGAGVVRIRHAT